MSERLQQVGRLAAYVTLVLPLQIPQIVVDPRTLALCVTVVAFHSLVFLGRMDGPNWVLLRVVGRLGGLPYALYLLWPSCVPSNPLVGSALLAGFWMWLAFGHPLDLVSREPAGPTFSGTGGSSRFSAIFAALQTVAFDAVYVGHFSLVLDSLYVAPVSRNVAYVLAVALVLFRVVGLVRQMPWRDSPGCCDLAGSAVPILMIAAARSLNDVHTVEAVGLEKHLQNLALGASIAGGALLFIWLVGGSVGRWAGRDVRSAVGEDD